MAEGEGPDLTQKGRAPSPEEVERQHQNADTDARKEAIHHTLGASENQASPGNHNHRGGDSVQLLGGVSITGSRGTDAWRLSITQALVALGATDSSTS